MDTSRIELEFATIREQTTDKLRTIIRAAIDKATPEFIELGIIAPPLYKLERLSKAIPNYQGNRSERRAQAAIERKGRK